MQMFTALFYYLTARWPRPLPKTDVEFNELKNILQLYFGIEDSCLGWMHVASEIQNTKITSLRKPYYLYANVVKKMEINGMCEAQKRLENEKLRDRLKTISEAMVKEGDDNAELPKGTHFPKADLPGMSEAEEDLGLTISQ